MRSQQEKPSWASLPRKGQLSVLCLIRITEPITRFCISSYIFYQLQYLDPSLQKDEIIKQASYLRSTYTLAQCVSSYLWGRVADSPLGGRKLVMLIALSCSFVSILLLGFISSFNQAVIIHAAQGFSNSNTAIVRTLVSEVVPQKRFQARAFVLLPICTSVATILGPLIAGLTVEAEPEPQGNHQSLLETYPYALPALINSTITLVSLLATFFFLEETLGPLRDRFDPGIAASRQITSLLSGLSRNQPADYEAIPLEANGGKESNSLACGEHEDQASSSRRSDSVSDEDQAETTDFVLPTRHIFTKKVLLILFAGVLMDTQIGISSDAMFNLFSFPVATKEQERHMVLPFRFTGGVGFKPSSLALTTCIFGLIGLPFQLFVYPRVSQRLGVLKTWRCFMFTLPVVWFLYPYFAVIPSSTPPPSEKTGFFIWTYIVLIAGAAGLFVGCVATCQLVLTAQATPHPSALGRTQSIAFFLSTAVRSSSSALSGTLLAYGLTHNLAGLPFWVSALVGAVATATSVFFQE